MNDIIDNFVLAAKDNYQTKQEPSKFAKFLSSSSQADLESSQSTNATLQHSNSWSHFTNKLP